MEKLTVLSLVQLQAGLWLVTGKFTVQEHPTRPPCSWGNSLSYPSSSSKQDCGWLQVNELHRKFHPLTLLMGKLTVLPLLQLQAGLGRGWFWVDFTVEELPPSHLPHGATHRPTLPPAPGRTVAGYR
jgi:hypothetical protein